MYREPEGWDQHIVHLKGNTFVAEFKIIMGYTGSLKTRTWTTKGKRPANLRLFGSCPNRQSGWSLLPWQVQMWRPAPWDWRHWGASLLFPGIMTLTLNSYFVSQSVWTVTYTVFWETRHFLSGIPGIPGWDMCWFSVCRHVLVQCVLGSRYWCAVGGNVSLVRNLCNSVHMVCLGIPSYLGKPSSSLWSEGRQGFETKVYRR